MILKSVKYLGDTIHSYFIVKRLNELGMPSKLFTLDKWKFLFDPKIITNELDGEIFSVDGDIQKLPHLNGRHARDRILHIFTDSNQTAPSSELTVTRKPSNHITICPRSSKDFKDWNGDWDYVENHLKNNGFNVVYDNVDDPLYVLVDNIINSKFIISVDTSCVHIAEAYNIPVVGLYGATSLKHFGPYSNRDFCIQKSGMQNIKPIEIVMQTENIKRKILSHGQDFS